ncbi:hypothetical protein [Streptomyces youssoufiensis]
MARVNLRAAFMSGMESTVAAQQVFTETAVTVTELHHATPAPDPDPNPGSGSGSGSGQGPT